MISYELSQKLRRDLKYPLGFLLSESQISDKRLHDIVEDRIMVTTVGDETTGRLIMAGITPNVQIVDGKSMRRFRPLPGGSFKVEKRVINSPGTISEQALSVMAQCFRGKGPTRIVVEGEEDLLVLPAIDLSPKGSVVLYGQPNEGIVLVEVDNKVKRKVHTILKEMQVDENSID